MPRPIERRSFKSYLGMWLTAVCCGLVAAVAGIMFGGRLFRENQLGGFEDLAGAILGLFVFYPLGVALGIFAFSRLFDYRGSIWLALLGAAVGTLGFIGLAEAFNINSDLALLSSYLCTALLATWGFHLKRPSKSKK